MNAKQIYDILRAGGLTRAGALGMLGNMMAESSLIPNIAQRGMTKLSDEQYTTSADAGTINFVHDSVGYGLCQWTFYSRKQALLDYAKEMGCSVGDGVMQCYFCLNELREDYTAVFKTLCSSDDIDACADIICTQFERPAVNNLADRRRYAHTFEADIPADEPSYKPPKKDPVSATFPPDPSVFILQMVMQYNGYWGTPDGHKSKEFFDKLEGFVQDMKKC